MVTRRQSLKAVVSSLFLPVFENSSFASQLDLKMGNRATAPGCVTCVNSSDLKAIYANVLDSATALKHVSLPLVLRSVSRASTNGLNVQYVSSVTGQLAFSMADMELHGMPSLHFERIYNSASKKDDGIGRGWATNYDDSITMGNGEATLFTAAGDVIRFMPDVNAATYVSATRGSGKVKKLTVVDNMTLREEFASTINKVYQKIGNAYYLSTIDFGDAGQLMITRDAKARVTSIGNSSKTLFIHLLWSSNGQLSGVTDSAERQVAYTYESGNLISHTDVTGAKFTYSYQDGQLTTVIDPAGTNVLNVKYDGARVAESNSLSGKYSYAYLSASAEAGVVTTVVGSDGSQTEIVHNIDG